MGIGVLPGKKHIATIKIITIFSLLTVTVKSDNIPKKVKNSGVNAAIKHLKRKIFEFVLQKSRNAPFLGGGSSTAYCIWSVSTYSQNGSEFLMVFRNEF